MNCVYVKKLGVISFYCGFPLIILFWMAGCACDPIRVTSQHIYFVVTDSKSGQAVPNAQIWIIYDLAHGKLLSKEERCQKRWEEEPWDTGFTNKNGHFDIDVKYMAIDQTLGKNPPSWRDWVSGQPYRLKIKKGQWLEDFDLILRPGEHVRGKHFTITVIQIQKPIYINYEKDMMSSHKSLPPPSLKVTDHLKGSGEK